MNLKLFLAMWCLSVPGIIAMEWLVLPSLVAKRRARTSLRALRLGSTIQTAILLAVAAAVGAGLASRVGLKAPALSALVQGNSIFNALYPQLGPGLIGGVIGAVLLYGLEHHGPPEMPSPHSQSALPLLSAVLYGGITEEILTRWGVMTLCVWLLWHLFQSGSGVPSDTTLWFGVALSALAFGLGHLPAARALSGGLRSDVVVWVVVGNTSFGFITGYLYWQFGLDSAMVAHALAHTLAFVFGQRTANT